MKDRVPANPGRVLITPEDGSAAFYATMTRADNPTQEGDPLNKNTLLKDATAALFGLTADAVPDDALSIIGKYTMYWWAKKHVPVYEVSIASETTTATVSFMGSSSLSRSVPYSSSVVIDENGTVSLENQSKVSVSYSNYTNAQTLRGKYFYADNGKLFYADSDASVTREGNSSAGYVVYISAHKVTSKNTASEAIVYVQSTDRNAYPDSGISGNYKYIYCGNPFDNAVLAGKPITGSYVGTGLYGSTNGVVIPFDFKPKLIIVYSVDIGTDASIAFLTESSPVGFVHYLQSSMGTASLSTTWYDSKVEFWSNYANTMLNVSGATYKWIALG